MIPTIGLMVGAYIVTRMLEVLNAGLAAEPAAWLRWSEEERAEWQIAHDNARRNRQLVVKIFAVITLVICLIGMMSLVSAGSVAANALARF